MQEPAEFWSAVEIGEADDCWEWQKSQLRSGYGRVYYRELGSTLAHRVAWILTNGPLDGKQVHHLCKNRSCCNPAHLESLSASEHVTRHRPIGCPRHGMSNIRRYKSANRCRTCEAEWQRQYRAAKRWLSVQNV